MCEFCNVDVNKRVKNISDENDEMRLNKASQLEVAAGGNMDLLMLNLILSTVRCAEGDWVNGRYEKNNKRVRERNASA